MNIGIKYKLILIFSLFSVLVISVINLHHYNKQWGLLIEQAASNKKDLSQQFIDSISLSIEGNNYGNIYLPSFVDHLKNTSSLLYLHVEGISKNFNSYQFSYHKDLGTTWRSFYEEGYKQQLIDKNVKLRKYLINDEADKVKVKFLLDRAYDELKRYEINTKHQHAIDQYNYQLNFDGDYFFDEVTRAFTITVPTTNSNGGKATFVYDINELEQLKDSIWKGVFGESLLALLITLTFVVLVAQYLVKPVEELTEYISHDIKSLDVKKVPGIHANDEVGNLAKAFRDLVVNAHLHLKSYENLSVKDPLTNLFNRRYFEEVVEKIFSRAKRLNWSISVMFIDIDHFKAFNEVYGREEGDEALVKVSRVLSQVTDDPDDYCFRFGGEEFVLLLSDTAPDKALRVAKKIRQDIQHLNLAHAKNGEFSHLTVTIGLSSVYKLARFYDVKSIIASADTELYKAMTSGKNKVSHTVF